MGRNIMICHPILQYKAAQLVALCEAQGLPIGISECFRTVAEQDALYAKGPGTTKAKGSTYSSMHQWGVAFDVYRNDGKGAYYNNDHFFAKVGAIGQSLGLEWGGAWTSIKDQPHFQLPYWGSTPTKLKQMYGNYGAFENTWYPTRPTSTVKKGSSLNDVNWVQSTICMYTTQNICIDRTWGKQTSAAITAYQTQLGWTPTGKAGMKTILALSKGRTQ